MEGTVFELGFENLCSYSTSLPFVSYFLLDVISYLSLLASCNHASPGLGTLPMELQTQNYFFYKLSWCLMTSPKVKQTTFWGTDKY